ncbi:hypothetical protein AGMMS49950_08780 [Endomicrobiia bacterium]|nr:hypothetical protein AGMMS49950_08780 [Endomicrobiia bacterium]
MIANFKRVQGYLRALEEYSKIFITLESASLRSSAIMHIFWKSRFI